MEGVSTILATKLQIHVGDKFTPPPTLDIHRCKNTLDTGGLNQMPHRVL